MLRQRSTFVHRRTAHLLSLQNLVVRNTGNLIKGNALKRLTPEEVSEQLDDPRLVLGADTHLAVIEAFNTQIQRLEKAVLADARLRPSFRPSTEPTGQCSGIARERSSNCRWHGLGRKTSTQQRSTYAPPGARRGR